jgi:isocitrate dehydrogenase
MYWARALADQTADMELAARFTALADSLEAAEDIIVEELSRVQGAPVDIGGYFAPDPQLAAAAMRPSETFNKILASAT